MHFHALGQMESEARYLGVKEWRAALHAMGHEGAIKLEQQVGGQTHGDVAVLHRL